MSDYEIPLYPPLRKGELREKGNGEKKERNLFGVQFIYGLRGEVRDTGFEVKIPL